MTCKGCGAGRLRNTYNVNSQPVCTRCYKALMWSARMGIPTFEAQRVHRNTQPQH